MAASGLPLATGACKRLAFAASGVISDAPGAFAAWLSAQLGWLCDKRADQGVGRGIEQERSPGRGRGAWRRGGGRPKRAIRGPRWHRTPSPHLGMVAASSMAEQLERPVLTLINKRLRNNRKKLRGIEEIQSKAEAGKELNADQVGGRWGPDGEGRSSMTIRPAAGPPGATGGRPCRSRAAERGLLLRGRARAMPPHMWVGRPVTTLRVYRPAGGVPGRQARRDRGDRGAGEAGQAAGRGGGRGDGGGRSPGARGGAGGRWACLAGKEGRPSAGGGGDLGG